MANFLTIFFIFLVSTINFVAVRAAITKCEKSVTTTSGTKAVNEKKICSGDLIFEESFDTGSLDFSIWEHDITFTGDSVWVFAICLFVGFLMQERFGTYLMKKLRKIKKKKIEFSKAFESFQKHIKILKSF